MKFLIKILCIISLASCNSKEDKIEIYLLKNRMENIEGVSLDKTSQYKQGDSVYLKKLMPETTVDTSKMKFIFAGKFDFRNNDLEENAFITNDEIEKINISKGVIQLNNKAGKKLLELNPNLRHGIQFVLMINDKPCLEGYFWNTYSSNGADWYCIQYEDLKTVKDTTLDNYKFSFYKGLGTSNPKKRDKISFEEFPELINALENSNKIER